MELLHKGWIVREGGAVVDASSSSVLVEIGDKRIVVDTGSGQAESSILESLAKLDITPSSVTHVVNTHLHLDHCGCNHLFDKAWIYCHPKEEPPSWMIKVIGDTELLPGLRIVHTPGHTRGSISVFAEGGMRVAVCGDAVPTKSNYESRMPPAIHYDRKIAVKSMEAILSWANVVVPGHDGPFEVMGKGKIPDGYCVVE